MDKEVSGWAIGWTAFAGIMMVMGGIWWIMAGIVALANDTFYVVGQEYIFQFDVTTWGWIHLLLGIVVLLAGFYLFTGAVWARMVGVIVAVLMALILVRVAALVSAVGNHLRRHFGVRHLGADGARKRRCRGVGVRRPQLCGSCGDERRVGMWRRHWRAPGRCDHRLSICHLRGGATAAPWSL